VGTAIFEGRIAGEKRIARPLWARVGAGIGLGGASDAAGDVRLVLPSIALGLRARSDPRATFAIGVGPTVDVGVAFASGSSSTARTLSKEAVTVRASLDADGRARLRGPLYAVVAVSGGVMVRGAELRADDRVVVGASGLALGVLAGVGAILP